LKTCPKLDAADAEAVQVVITQHVPHPGRTTPSFWRAAVVAVIEREQVATIAREQCGRACSGFLGVQQHIVHGITERVLHSALATVEGQPVDMIDAPRHSAAIAI
jgi:hypothetical protein